MNVSRIAILVGLLAAVPGGGPALGHGASKGLHVHVDPERAAPGDVVTVSLDASRPIANVRIGVTGEDVVVEVVPDPPARRLETTVPIPDAADGVVNVHAEARTIDGSTVRAAAVVTIVQGSSLLSHVFSDVAVEPAADRRIATTSRNRSAAGR